MQDEAREGLLADMDGEEFAEEGGAGGEDAEGSGAEARVRSRRSRSEAMRCGRVRMAAWRDS